MAIKIQIVGIDSLRAAKDRLGRSQASLATAARQAGTESGFALRSSLKAFAPKRTGAMARSIGFRTGAGVGGVTLTFYADQVAAFVIGGTRPHLILPRDKKALFWPGAAHPVRVVHHPGTKANDFRKPAWSAVRGDVRTILRNAGQAVAQGGIGL